MAQLRALFLDRDDTVIKNIPYMSDYRQIEYLPSALNQIKKIQDLGFSIFFVTNQSGLSRGLISYEQLEKIHQQIKKDLSEKGIRIFKFYISPYIHKHPRRKPGPELLFEAERDFNINLKESIMMGDGQRDIDAGYNAGLKLCYQIKDIQSFWTPKHFDKIYKEIADFKSSF